MQYQQWHFPDSASNKQERGACGRARDYSNILNSLQFGEFRGKKIILCDDVVTSGRSFRIIAEHLTQLGATEVTGLMLAKTHWQEEATPF